ncbi:glutamate-cysteine ligase family protein [Rhodococcus gannanensis]|uniref:Glutamate-cysteine ligase family protein n=1 Tax=Rhodococcus gannanensis TaxID=1960308 RepID=A0ABW4P676_9NOCA
MGREVTSLVFTRRDRQVFREKVHACLDALADLLADERESDTEPTVGLEVELNLVDAECNPAMVNASALEAIADPAYQTELGQFNIEVNVDPRTLDGDNLAILEGELRRTLNQADGRAAAAGGRLAMIGILPTLRKSHLQQRWMSSDPRYTALDQQIFAARGEDIELDIAGVPMPGHHDGDRLAVLTDTILAEAACTSTQLHLQVSAHEFGTHWNSAQMLAGVQVAIAANSPFFAGRALWHETRLPLFEQATDTRPLELRNQGVRPRVWFGERWISSIFDLFEENSRYFPALLPECTDEDPRAVIARGGTPELAELRMHNGTIYRWNRPIYDTTDTDHHLRLENRVLPAGPTVRDTVADAAFYYGAVRALAAEERPAWSRMPFEAAAANLQEGARHGFGARLYWPDRGWTSPSDLVLSTLLPLAHAGLDSLRVDPHVRDTYLGVIEDRCRTGRNGARWQRDAVAAREAAGEDRERALAGMVADYLDRMHSDAPVHTWDAPGQVLTNE